MREERREANALVVITAAGVVIGLLAGMFMGANIGPDMHRILLLGASIVLFSSVVAGILIYKWPYGQPAEVAEPMAARVNAGVYDAGSEG